MAKEPPLRMLHVDSSPKLTHSASRQLSAQFSTRGAGV